MRPLLIFSACLVAFYAPAQERQSRYDFPVTITLCFPALAMPFRNLDLNFKNIGIGLGTELTLNHDGSWVQQLTVAWLGNRQAGNGLLVYTQLGWRPAIGSNGFAELKAGAGYLYAFTPSTALKPNGGAGHRGKGMLTVPIGVAMGYHHHEDDVRYSPFLGYQFMVVTRYNNTVPVVPQTIVQAGISIAQ